MHIALEEYGTKAGRLDKRQPEKQWIAYLKKDGRLFTWSGSKGTKLRLRKTALECALSLEQRADKKRRKGCWDINTLPSNNIGADEVLQVAITRDTGYVTAMDDITHQLKHDAIASEVKALFNTQGPKTKHVVCSLYNLGLMSYLVYFKRELPEAITIRNLEGEELSAKHLWHVIKYINDNGRQHPRFTSELVRINKIIQPESIERMFADIATSRIPPFCF